MSDLTPEQALFVCQAISLYETRGRAAFYCGYAFQDKKD